MDRAMEEKLSRVKKLMEEAATPGEAEAAAAAFQRLILRWNISEEEAARVSGEKTAPYVRRYVEIAKPNTPGIVWKVSLYTTLAHFNFCKVFLQCKGGAHVVFVIGQDANISNVSRLYLTTSATFERLAIKAFEAAVREWAVADPRFGIAPKEIGIKKPNSTKFRTSFLYGAVSGLWHKMYEERESEKTEVEGTSALVVVKDEEINRESARLMGKTRVNNHEFGISDQSAFNQGWKTGYAHSSNENLSSTTTKALKG